jgi:hypothetical protein
MLVLDRDMITLLHVVVPITRVFCGWRHLSPSNKRRVFVTAWKSLALARFWKSKMESGWVAMTVDPLVPKP